MTGFLNTPWLPLAMLFMLSLIARKLQGSWLAPSAFPGLLWSLYIGLPLIATQDHISGQSIWLLLCLISCLQVGAFIFVDPVTWKHAKPVLDVRSSAAVGDRCLRLSLLFAIVAFVGGVFYVAIWLRNLNLTLSVVGFFSLGSNMYDIIVGGIPDPWWFRLSRMWVFPSALLGGVSAALVQSRKKELLTLGALVSALFMGIAIASRLGIALSIACWLGGYFCAKCQLTRGGFRLNPRFVATIALIACAAVGIYSGLYLVRGRQFENVSEASVMLGTDLLAYLAVFDNWVRYPEPQPLSFGAYSFGGIFEFVGLKSRERALNYEPVVLKSGIDSNIYTAFRGLIEDFSLPGSMLLLLIVGAVVGWAYTRLCSGKISWLWALSAYYIYILWSPIMSAFYYNGILLAVLVAAFAIRDPKHRPLWSTPQAL